jgi:cation diffusion facilitator family transporter
MRAIHFAIGSIIVGIFVLAIKFLAYWVTGSVALLSDTLESIVNVATAIAALVAVRIAMKPADARHPYGHHKAELLSAVFEGVMIILAALLIFREAYEKFLMPMEIGDYAVLGLSLNGVASIANAVWCHVLIRNGRKLHSPALVADGWHLFTDVISSLAVILGIILAIVTGWYILDPILALFVAVNILWSGWKVVTSSLSGLMDEAVSEETLRQVRKIIANEAEGALQAHDLRTRQAGRRTFIDFHLVVPGHVTVSESHEICDRVEHALHELFPDASISIHVEPDEKAKQTGISVI